MINKLINMRFIYFILCVSCVIANSRVGFSRPGAVIRTPGNVNLEHFNQYIVGYSTEIINISDLNKGIYIIEIKTFILLVPEVINLIV